MCDTSKLSKSVKSLGAVSSNAPRIVQFTMSKYLRSKSLVISKPIHIWNPQGITYTKINVGICTDTVKAAILDFHNGRHKIHNLQYLDFYLTEKLV